MFEKGCKLFEQSRFDEAVEVLSKLVARGPLETGPYGVLAAALSSLGRYKEAADILGQAIEKDVENENLYTRKAYALYGAGDVRGAMGVMDEALERFPGNHHVLLSYGTLCTKCGTEFYLSGAQALEKILEVEPEHLDATNLIGSILAAAGKHNEAIPYFIKVLRAKPDHMIALLNIAGCFEKTGEPEMALKFYNSILEIDPHHGLAMAAKATILSHLGLSAEYSGLLEQGIKRLLEVKDLTNFIIYASNYIFYVHYVPGFERKKILETINEWYKQTCSKIDDKPRVSFENVPEADKALRIGLISNSFKRHPATWMTLAAIENLDRKKHEIFLYSDIVAAKRDDVTRRYYGMCDKVHEIKGMSNEELVARMREDELDMLIELTGHSEGGRRLAITAARVAPVQTKWVGGLFDTTGVPQMDWLIGDKIQIPEGDEKWYTERVYRMPDDYIVYEPPFYVHGVRPLPALKNGYVTFGNLNNLCKTNTYTISLWARILRSVPGSRLLMKVQNMDTPFAKKHVEESFAAHGIGIERLILEGGEPHKAFMESHSRCDIALDPHPYTGGLTTCEALWMGVPVVTLPGETFAGRHAATHLYHAGYQDWIAKDEDDYVNIAVKWANDLEALAKLRAGMREQVRSSPLTDGPRFARNLEKALRHMWVDWCEEKVKYEEGLRKGEDVAAPSKSIKPPRPKKKTASKKKRKK